MQSRQGAQPQMGAWLDAMCHQNPLSVSDGMKSLDLLSEINSGLASSTQLNENTVILSKNFIFLRKQNFQSHSFKTFTPNVT